MIMPDRKLELAKKLQQREEEERKTQLKAKLLKIKLAATGMGRNFPSTSEARRGLVQDTKNPSASIEGSNTQTQSRLRAEGQFIRKKKPIRPTGADAKISPDLKKRLAKIKLQKTAHDHGHTIIMKGHSKGLYRSASLENQQGHFAKYWLLNAKQTNGNGWGIASHSAKENMHKFIGRPLVVTSAKWRGSKIKDRYGDTFDHPYVPTNDLNKIFEHQEQYRVGNIVDIGEKNGDYYAMIEMLPKFANMSLPPFCSPAIYQLDAREAEGQISKWEALHLAALDENPAYGARIALLKGTCVGTNNECRVQFKSAKLKEVNIVCTKGAKEKLAKLKKKLRLANQGEQNMTFQDSKKIKIHKRKHPEVRKAQTSIEDVLRKSGRSVDGSHHQSSFLSSTGDFIGGGGDHLDQIGKIEKIDLSTVGGRDGDDVIAGFSKKHGIPRVQNFPINRAGEKRTSIGISSKINKSQLKSIIDLEKGGQGIGFAVGEFGEETVGSGSKDLMKALREKKFL